MSALIDWPVSGRFHFDDPDALSAAMPGGRFGVLPLEQGPFHSTIHSAVVASDLLVRQIGAGSAISIRSEFIGTRPTITLLMPSFADGHAFLDGHEFSDHALAIRTAGDTPHLRTIGRYEIAAFTIDRSALQSAAEAIVGQSLANFLHTPTTMSGAAASHVAKLRKVQLEAREIASSASASELAQRGPAPQLLMRDKILAVVVSALSDGHVKPDHLAVQLQTRSMARIERYLDDHRETVTTLQELCAGTRLPLRTVERIILSRTGVSALAYLRRRRLAFVRHALLHPSDVATVTSAAIRFGFWHLGRFAAFYQQVYGERPSETLVKSMGRAKS